MRDLEIDSSWSRSLSDTPLVLEREAPMRLSQLQHQTLELRWAGSKDEIRTHTRASRIIRLLGDPPAHSLSTSRIHQLVVSLRKEGLGPASINRHLSALSALLSTARALGLECPVELPWQTEPPPRDRSLSSAQVGALADHLGGWERNLTMFLVQTGLRPSEALSLRWEDVVGTEVVIRDSKSGRSRRVPLNEEACRALPLRTVGSERVFRTSLRTYQRRFKAAARRADLPAWASPYCLRHTFATRLTGGGVPLNVAQKLLGHASVKTTVRYAHVTDEAMRAAVTLVA